MTNYFTSAWRRAGLVLAGLLLSGTTALAQNIGIGTNAPTQTLDVNGDLRVRGLSNTSGRGRLLSVLPDGTLSAGEQLGALSGLGANAQFQPTPAVSLPTTSGTSDMATDGRYIYVLGSNEVLVYDAATPPNPIPAGPPIPLRSGTWAGIVVGNGYAYIADNTGVIDVYQITTPTSFVYRQTVNNLPTGATNAALYDLVLAGNYLYYAGLFTNYGTANAIHLATYDLTTPASPARLNVLEVPNSRGRIVLLAANEQSRTLYASVDGRQLTQYRLAEPGMPTAQVAISTTTQPSLQRTGIVGGVYYQIDVNSQDIYVSDVSGNAPSPPRLGQLTAPDRVRDLVFIGRYAYFLGSSTAGKYILAATIAAPSVLTFTPSGNITTQTAVLPVNNDNLGNHTATQNLNLGAFKLVGNGGTQGLSITSSGQVGIGTTAPAAALDVNGAVRATTLTTTGAIEATIVEATSIQTPAVYTPATGSHNMLVQAYGAIGSGGNAFGTTDNYTVFHTAGTNTYRISFTAASGLSTTSLSAAVMNLTLYGISPGFATYTTTTPGAIDVTTTNAGGQAAERGFAFTVYLP
jgi:hypothetical protein